MEHTRRWRRRSIVAAATAGLVAALTMACGAEAESPAGAGASDDHATDEAEAELRVTAPTDGDTVTVPFEVTVEAGVDLGPIENDLHHLHIWFGDDPTDQEGFELHTSARTMVEQAPAGDQTMWVQVHTVDHQPVGDPVAVSVTIEGGDDTADEADRGGGDDY
jgi:hypothetical protein